MKKVQYWRYSATGNTFLIFDNRQGKLHGFSAPVYSNWSSAEKVDGLLFLEAPQNGAHDFHMRYLNADGGEVEMCGNGARSIIHFAKSICGLTPKSSNKFVFSTKCSTYSGVPSEELGFPIEMSEVGPFDSVDIADLYEPAKNSFYLFTGVPHCCFEVEDLEAVELLKEGSRIRYHERFENGTNVNFFVVLSKAEIAMRTYERGVEGETKSCGTGATAVALCSARKYLWQSPVKIKVPGGELKIGFDESFQKVSLSGEVELLGNSFFDFPQS